jgi:hypothetical protein
MIKTGWQKLLQNSSDKKWLAAYAATILLPWGLIFSRGLADACCAFIGLLFLWESYAKKQWGWLADPLVKLGIIAWIWLLVIITPFAASPPESFFVAAPWIRYILLYAALRHWVLTGRKELLLLVKALAFMLALVMVDTLWQYITGTSLSGHIRDESGRLTGPMSNVKVGIFTAKLLLPISGICLFFSVLNRKRNYIVYSISLLLGGIMIIMLSGERTAFFSTIIAVSALAACLAIVEPTFRKILLIGIAILTIGVGFMFVTQHWVQIRAHDFYLTISNFFASNYGQLFKAGYFIGKEHWLTGAGLKGFRELCPELITSHKVEYCNLHPHNPYLEWFAEAGAVGILLFISMVAYMAYICLKAFRRQQGMYRILPAFAFACIISNFFPFMPTQSIFSNWPAILLWYCVSIAISSLNIKEDDNKAAIIRQPS